MRVLIANKYFYRRGGAEAVMFQERDSLLNNGVEVVDFSMLDQRNVDSRYSSYFVRHRDYSEKCKNILFRAVGGLELIYSPEAVDNFQRIIDATKPDIVHCHNIYHQLTPSIIGVAKARGIPVVLTLHDYKVVCPTYLRLQHGRVCSECLTKGIGRVLVNRCAGGSVAESALMFAEAMFHKLAGNYKKVDMMLAPSEFMLESVVQAGFPRERVRVLRNGVDVETIYPSGLDDNYVLFLGRLSAEKGLPTLLEAHNGLKKVVRLVVAGAGPLEQSLINHYRDAKFVGYLSGAELREVVTRAGAVVMPSECYENCPMALLEAMAYGKAVVASDLGGIPELVVHGQTGLLFAPGNVDALRDHLKRVMTDARLRADLGAAARVRVEQRFSLEQHNRSLYEAYVSLL